jgi:hypothetical protein
MPAILLQTAVALLTYAYGANWNAGRAQRDMLIFEGFSAWAHGDEYVYVESQNLATVDSSSQTTLYAEVHARIGGPVNGGPLRAVFAAEQVDVSQGDRVLLTGAGFAWSVLQTDVFVRYDPADAKPTWQAVAYGEWPIRVGPVRLGYGGYVKVVGAEGADVAFLVSDTRLLWHPTPHLGAGLALRVWRNENGVRGINEAVPEAVVQWRF